MNKGIIPIVDCGEWKKLKDIAFNEGKNQGVLKELNKEIKWFKQSNKELIIFRKNLKENKNNHSKETIDFSINWLNLLINDYRDKIEELQKRKAKVELK